ncbi:scarecrow-like protein 33 [Carica papaya]|uniref:scarecrow-like protein 33 n=1 Tax=Carica papaya TaxID=3649 RepID=UPI000B8C7A3D|nr:scarecrow-like protein 33 [Carica papaya]
MDPQFNEYLNSMEGFTFENESIFPNSDQSQNLGNGFKLNNPTLDLQSIGLPPDPSFPNSDSAWSRIIDGDSSSPSDDNDFSDTVLKYISQVLMEEDMDEKPCMFHDALALQAAEKSLYEVIGEKYPPSPDQPPIYSNKTVDSPDDCCSSGFSDSSTNSHSSPSTSTSFDSHSSGNLVEHQLSWLQTPVPTNFVFQSTSNSGKKSSFNSADNVFYHGNGLVRSSMSELLDKNLFNESDSMLQFQRGVEEASKFLPKGNQLIIDLESYKPSAESKDKAPNVVVKTEKHDTELSPNQLIGKKSHEREDEDLEDGRSNKQSAVYGDESELSEMFDKVLLYGGGNEQPGACILDYSREQGALTTLVQNESSKPLQKNGLTNGSGGGKSRGKKLGKKKEVVDLRTLLILCAQAVSANDSRTANELLKQIRQHSSSFGDGSQRLAHYFANSLEARLAGTGTQIYTALSSKRNSSAVMLKAYQTYISICPFMKIAIIFANHTILSAAEKATALHIIDFGISYGFQWPALIHRLSMRPGGPPKLRITGIELPQSGFRPAKGVQETGRHLEKYCERFNVPFEYTAIGQKWETIKINDLKLNPDEFVAVNCLFRFRNLLDETVVLDSPRNAVLNLIRKISPNIFIQAIVNGSYNTPFFVTRFKEALFHYSALFDMCDTNMPREDEMRLMFEKEFYGREIMSVLACEGTGRVERPETYKQWQVRNSRAGFRQLPLDPELIRKFKCKVKDSFHNDFMVDEDSGWMLQGWKGRIVYASSAWVPA